MVNRPFQTLHGVLQRFFAHFFFLFLLQSYLKELFDLDCSIDWLREVVRTKWQSGTGIGASRRQRPKEEKEKVDVEVVEIQHAVANVTEVSLKDEKDWLNNLQELFVTTRVPPPIELSPKSEAPGVSGFGSPLCILFFFVLVDIQEEFRNKMLEYWAKNGEALHYSEPLEPMNTG